ncbi:MAG: helix-turn-helix domain-containing protein [Gloeotrichia echinulata GP01]
MSKHAGISRFTYNWGLATWQALYQSGYQPNHLIRIKYEIFPRIHPHADIQPTQHLFWCRKLLASF